MPWADARLSSPAARLDAPELAWLLNRRLWVALMMPGLLTLGLLFSLGIFPEGRLINPTEQYAWAFPGDLFLWLGMGSTVYLVIRHFSPARPLTTRHWCYMPRRWLVAAIIVAVAMALLLTGGEIHAILTNPTGSATYTWAQFWSPTHLAHSVIVPVMAYTNVRIMPALFFTRESFYPQTARWVVSVKVLAVLGYLGWFVCAIILDNFVLPRPDLADIHPLDGGWFSGWWPGVRDALLPEFQSLFVLVA